jgi:type II secretory pathway pseudopilin PulG
LVEVTVVSAIFTIVLAALFGMVVSLSNSDVRAQQLANNVDEVRNAAQAVSRDVRGANPLMATDSVTSHSLSANEVIAAVGASATTQSIVAWRYDSTAKTLSRCTRAANGTTVTCKTVLTNVNRNSTTAVFRYYCTSGAELSPLGATGPTDVAKAGVRVRIALQAAPATGPNALPIEADAEIRNRPGDTGC